MENKKSLTLVALAIFSIVILFGQKDIPFAYALSVETVNVGYTATNTSNPACDYIDSEEVWCVGTSGIKIFNPSSRTTTGTLYSGVSGLIDIVCNGTYCFTWHQVSAVTYNLTQWIISTQAIGNTTLFTNNVNHASGTQIDIVSAQGATLLLLPVTGIACGATPLNAKGVCIWDYTSNSRNKFVSSTDETTTAVIQGVIWNGILNTVSQPTINRMVVDWQFSNGTKKTELLNLNSADTTFPLLRICHITTNYLTSGLKMHMIDDDAYIPISGGYFRIDSDSSSCANLGTISAGDTLPVSIEFEDNSDQYFLSAYTDNGGNVESSISIFNSTFGIVAILETDGGTTDYGHYAWLHDSEGEYQYWRGSAIKIVVDAFTPDSPVGGGTGIINGVDCNDPIKAQTLLCRNATVSGISAPSELLNQTTTNLLCQSGLIACTADSEGNLVPDNPDMQTNGVGYLMAGIALGVMIGIFWVASRGDLTSIPTFVWFIGTVSIIGAMTAFEYIDATFLIISIIAIIALAVAKAKGIFSGNQIFAGETN